MADIKRATELVNQINEYEKAKVELDNDKYELNGLHFKHIYLMGSTTYVTFNDVNVVNALKLFVTNTMIYYNNRIKELTEELSNL